MVTTVLTLKKCVVTFKLMEEGTPILGMVSVVGTTEEGSIDPVHEVMKLRQECEEIRLIFLRTC